MKSSSASTPALFATLTSAEGTRSERSASAGGLAPRAGLPIAFCTRAATLTALPDRLEGAAVRAFALELSANDRARLEQEALAAALWLAAELRGLPERADDPSSEEVLALLLARDALETARAVLACGTASAQLAAAIRQVDRAAIVAMSALPISDAVAAHPRLAAIARREPHAWWADFAA